MCGRVKQPNSEVCPLNYLITLPPRSSVLLAPPLLSWGTGLGLCCWGLKKAWKQSHFSPSYFVLPSCIVWRQSWELDLTFKTQLMVCWCAWRESLCFNFMVCWWKETGFFSSFKLTILDCVEMKFTTNNALWLCESPKNLVTHLYSFKVVLFLLKEYPGSHEYKIRGTELSTKVSVNFIPVTRTPSDQWYKGY